MSNHEEKDRLFDHEFDGIREYDNPMPTWWKWLFGLTILFCFPYVLWYHFGLGPSIHDNLEAEQAAYAQMLIATYGDLQPDPATILAHMDDETAMTGMRSLFKGKCAQCHLADGSGSVGPNLTDDQWINVKTIADIPELLSKGVVARGMPAWDDQLTQTQIVLLSSYVARLRRNPLPGKESQGETIAPWPRPAEVETPSAGESPESETASSG